MRSAPALLLFALAGCATALSGCATSGRTAGAVIGGAVAVGLILSVAGEGDENDPALAQCYVDGQRVC